MQNNAWGSSAGQTISYGPGTKFKVTVQNGSGVAGAPASYPSIFIGANNTRSTASSGLPKAVSALGGVQTSWTWAENGASGAYNAAYDVWFSTSAGGDPSASSPSGGYLMVWLYKPAGNSPIGAMITSTTIGGKNGTSGTEPTPRTASRAFRTRRRRNSTRCHSTSTPSSRTQSRAATSRTPGA